MSTQNHCSAETYYQQAIEHWKLEQQDSALQYFKKATKLEPSNDHYWYALGGVYHTNKKYKGAKFCFERSLAINSCQPDISLLLCEINYALSNYSSVVQCSELIDLKSVQNTEILYKIALSLQEIGQVAKAGEVCAHILEIDDQFWQAKTLAAELLRKQGYVGEVKVLLLELLQQNPTFGNAWNELAICEMAMGNEESALAAFTQAETYTQTIKASLIGSNYLFEFSSGLRTPQEVLQAHQTWASKYFDLQNQSIKLPVFDSVRKVKIAYLSGDFRSHSVSYFIQGILESHLREQFEIILLSNTKREDKKTDVFKALADQWIDIKDLDDEDITQQIKALKIDILVDLSGHTDGNKLSILSQQIAPVQMTYIGYFATTGLPTIDYWITDEVVHPLETPELSTEKIIRLPRCYLAYQPSPEAPIVAETPALKNGFITFGSFVASRKISDYSVMLWAAILQEVPNSQLLIKNRNCRSSIYRSELLDKFALCGVDSDQIILDEAKPSLAEHLEIYNKIDIALDTYPASGCTTTAEALWMGVPVLTRLGDLMVSRNSASLLHALNLQDWIAETDEEYIEKGIQFAQSIDQLVLLRQGMRERFMQSELYDSQDLTRHLEDFYLKALQEKLSGNREVRL
ncbi:tetratricopeptide repeat protein [Synechococcus elongatus]|uniref:protein O-GlcNAc transferase n=1 Tax=Synechococcus elongatus PCC 11802 TaxID=2283154 RepID=A0AAT9JZL6_SYNEL|nr:SPY protein [Synechococcus elongatus]QFZ91008.1 SPY protein [Synechococcus elongatus PCC 11802]